MTLFLFLASVAVRLRSARAVLTACGGLPVDVMLFAVGITTLGKHGNR
jgi:hypothetical protein